MSRAVSRTLANAVDLPKHNGNGDNRFAILIEGSKGDIAFDRSQFRGHIQEMGLMLTEHHNNTKPGPGYTGYYLQDQINYVGVHDNFPKSTCDFPYLERDKEVTSSGTTGKENILRAIQDVARKADSYDKVMLFYTAYGGKIGTIPYFDANTDGTFLSNKDIKADELDKYLDTIECKDMAIILQPDYSGDWITPLEQDSSGGITTYETNRVILTSEQSGQTLDSKFDKCNIIITDTNDHKVFYTTLPTDIHSPIGDEENYDMGGGNWIYVVSDSDGGSNDGVYEIDEDGLGIDFYENPNDFGAEFVSGLTEGYYIDRDYYGHSANDDLDADIDVNNDYISCKETYDFMKLWHLGYKLGSGITHGTVTNPWYDDPKIEYTWLEEGAVYLY